MNKLFSIVLGLAMFVVGHNAYGAGTATENSWGKVQSVVEQKIGNRKVTFNLIDRFKQDDGGYSNLGDYNDCYTVSIDNVVVKNLSVCIPYDNGQYKRFDDIKIYSTDMKDYIVLYSNRMLGYGSLQMDWNFVNLDTKEVKLLAQEISTSWCDHGNSLMINNKELNDLVDNKTCKQRPNLIGFNFDGRIAYKAKVAGPLNCGHGGGGYQYSYDVCATTKTVSGISRDFSTVYFNVKGEYLNNKAGYTHEDERGKYESINMSSWANSYSLNLKNNTIQKEKPKDKIKITLIKKF